jgi:hypothetical protein
VKNLPKQWYCSDNIHDPKRANCDAPEQTAKDILREKKRMKKRQQKLLEKAVAAEAAAANENSITGGSSSDVVQPSSFEKNENELAQPLKKKSLETVRSPRPSKPEKTLPKPKRARTPVIDEMGARVIPPTRKQRKNSRWARKVDRWKILKRLRKQILKSL